MNPDIADSLGALARDVAAWDGTHEAAAGFRARLPTLPPLKGKPDTPEEGVLARIGGLYGKKETIGLTDALKAASATIRAPFIGDPKMGAWPFHDALHIDDEPAEQWLAVFKSRHVVDDPLRLFVSTMFAARRRELWVPAAEVFGFHATHDEPSRALLITTWATCFPQGIPARWPGGGILAGDASADRHLARHVLSAACSHVVHNGVVPGFDPSKLTAVGPPTDAADASALLLALTVLLRADGQRAPVSLWLGHHAPAIPADPQCDAALRGLFTNVDLGAAAAVRERLILPTWRSAPGPHVLDGLCSWLETAAWFKDRGDSEAVTSMMAHAGDAGPALLTTLGERTADPLARLLTLLPVAMDADVFATTRSVECLLAELLALVKTPELANIPWRPLVTRAMGPAVGASAEGGTVAQGAIGDLAMAFTERGLYVGGTYRGRWYAEDDVLRFAPRASMATQVGVQMERLLRLCHLEPATLDRGKASPKSPPREPPEERQVRLLWRLLRADPPPGAFREIGRVMRGENTALHQLIRTVESVDTERIGPGLREAYRALTDRAAELVAAGGAEPHVVGVLRGLSKALSTAGGDTETSWDPCEFPRRLPALLVALSDWADWWGLDGNAIRVSWTELERRLDPCFQPHHTPGLVELGEVEAALTKVAEVTAVLVWPEATLVNTEIGRWRAWITSARQRANAAARANARVREALDRGGESACIALLGPGEAERQTIAALPPADITRLHRFFLQRWLFSEAKELAERAGDRVELMPVRRHLAMVFVGVATGPILVVDFGVVFNSVLLPGRSPAFAATVLLCALGTLAVLGTAVRSPPHAAVSGGSHEIVGALARLRATLRRASASGTVKARRAVWVWLATYAEAMVLSMLFLEILSNNLDLRTVDGATLPWLPQVLLWTGLSQFLGIFVGVVAQGESVGREQG